MPYHEILAPSFSFIIKDWNEIKIIQHNDYCIKFIVSADITGIMLAKLLAASIQIR